MQIFDMRKIAFWLGAVFLVSTGIYAETLDTRGPEAIADAFHAAITNGDEAAVDRILATDVKILEGGHAQQSLGQYKREHMHDDMAFMAGMERTVLDRSVNEDGNIAWVVTHARISGTYNEREMDIILRELLVMQQTSEGWQINLVEWASK